MPRINHYEAEVTLRFIVDGPLSLAEAATVVEERASRSLAGEASEGNSIQSAQISAIAISDTEIRRIAGGQR
jgi:hypothetical protein